MASKDRKSRCLGALVGLFLGVLSVTGRGTAQTVERADPVETPEPTWTELRNAELAIMDRLAATYGSTDWSAVSEFLWANPGYEGNPNIAFLPLSLGNVYCNRYQLGNDTADFERSLDWLGWVAENHCLWGRRWLSAPVVSYLDVSLFRLRGERVPPVASGRLEAVWAQALAITTEEADARLTPDFPYGPYDSSVTGDSKGEENAWEAGLLAAGANFLPNHPHAAAWERKARQLAYNAITRPSDPEDFAGVKTTTVSEDFTLSNHGFFPNPTYAAATIELLLQAALTYRVTGRDIPSEFSHNVSKLYEALKSYTDSDLGWIVPSDPDGEASLFPFFFDPELEDREVRCRLDSDSLWVPAEPVAVMEVGAPLWTAALNSKVVMFYLMGSYLWHFPPGTSGGDTCSSLR